MVPAVVLALFAGILAASWLGGDPGAGLISLAGLIAFGGGGEVSARFWVWYPLACWPCSSCSRGRSETIRGLRGDGRDERFAQIDLQATAADRAGPARRADRRLAGGDARGQSGSPYDWLLAIGGLAYLLAVAWFRWRG